MADAKKVIVITGSSDGIGKAAARAIHDDGEKVVVVGRDPDKTQAVLDELDGADGFVADFTRLTEVRQLATDLDAAYPRIDVLANNAGGLFGDPSKTEDGFEQTFQVNHLAPFLLTNLLMPKLADSGASVIQTASIGARAAGKLNLDDLDLDSRFGALRAYNQAKLENILFTRELHRRYREKGIAAVAFHPGLIASNFGAQSNSRLFKAAAGKQAARKLMGSPEKGAEQLRWLARGTPGVDWEPGVYYEWRRPARGLRSQAKDDELARRLWDKSELLVTG